jgi:hypothetical protein
LGLTATAPFEIVTIAGTALAVPPVPLQLSEYVVVAVTAPVLCAPLVDLLPFQPPDAMHEVAFVELQLRVDVPPLATTDGFTVNVTVGMPPFTTTVAVITPLVPPAPLQSSENDVVAARAPVLCEPLVDLLPLQPPDAAHEVALVELHVNTDALPLLTEFGFAVSVTVAAGKTATVAVATLLAPPAPVQANECVVVVVSGAVFSVPLVDLLPLQPPDAVHEVALIEFHVSTAALPLATAVGFAVSVTAAGGTVAGGWFFDVSTPPPHAANSSDAAAGTYLSRPLHHKLIILKNPCALRGSAVAIFIKIPIVFSRMPDQSLEGSQALLESHIIAMPSQNGDGRSRASDATRSDR